MTVRDPWRQRLGRTREAGGRADRPGLVAGCVILAAGLDSGWPTSLAPARMPAPVMTATPRVITDMTDIGGSAPRTALTALLSASRNYLAGTYRALSSALCYSVECDLERTPAINLNVPHSKPGVFDKSRANNSRSPV
jgi:hypothetical protein